MALGNLTIAMNFFDYFFQNFKLFKRNANIINVIVVTYFSKWKLNQLAQPESATVKT